MKGIILAGGSGTRLDPLTKNISKQLLPVYDKPMIYYPLSVLMMAGIKDILIISTPRDIHSFSELLGNGKNLGINLRYATQPNPEGIAQAIQIAEPYFAGEDVCLILGDNIFYGEGFPALMRKSIADNKGATIFTYQVHDPERFGVAEFDKQGKVLSLEEKPLVPKSQFAVTGLYLYSKEVYTHVQNLKPSSRGELEITDLNRVYLAEGSLQAIPFGRGFAWLDTGTHESLLEASQFISILERRQGLKIACLEEIALRFGLISKEEFSSLLKSNPSKSSYYEYLRRLEVHGI